ncbi:aminodeoxychorismate synthase component I [Salibaculum griseiflavum]|uniref:Aminodeoxychorismate synthase component I n=1 Tax=Salibaculum griseiflavum TaxID=1914409 RepID=A0A2V1P7I4_9RHOB|nr:aminodeoxychorismate synthase component I [Salibaculum griseiflavum]
MRLRFDSLTETGDAAAWFDGASDLIRADGPADVPAALAALDRARASGKWLAGYASYELGYALEEKLAGLMPEARRLPLLCFGVYDGPRPADALADGPARIGPLRPRWDAGRYAAAFARVHDWIGAGDIYQANLTFPIDTEVTGESEALYAALSARQKVGHGALVLQEGLPDILSRSPELFFRIHADGRLETLPMKGTMPRGETALQDALNKAHLSGDVKNRAENLMIVDLLRNDLSRIAEIGSVRVPELFHVQTYATVHQMVSRVVGQLRAGTGLADVFAALYPCGSITGAPKVRAMEIIHALEDTPREAYCGTIGWAAPDGRAEFNVAIRTLMRDGDAAVLNVGGGVVWDSTAENEYEEALWKARYATL